MHLVKVGDKIRVLVDGAACTTERAGAILEVLSLKDTTGFLTNCTNLAYLTDSTWVFCNEDIADGSIEIVERAPKNESHDFHVKRLKALKKSAKELGWVQLGLGDVDMLDKLISLLEQ